MMADEAELKVLHYSVFRRGFVVHATEAFHFNSSERLTHTLNNLQ